MSEVNTPAPAAPTVPSVTVKPPAPASIPNAPKPVVEGVSINQKSNTIKVSTPLKPVPKEEVKAEPELILGKFKTHEDVIAAYKELEAKHSGKKEEPKAVEPAKTVGTESNEDAVIASFSKFTEELTTSDSLSEDSYKELSKMGYPKQIVDQYIAGQRAIQSQGIERINSMVGGKESFQSMIDWASTNLSEGEKNAYNQAVNSNSQDSIDFAVKGLYSKYKDATKEPELLAGSTLNQAFGYESQAQMLADMADPRYKKDPAYRATVMKKLANKRY